MLRKPEFTSLGVALLMATILFSTPVIAAQRGEDPRDPITRMVKYLKRVFTIITTEDGMTPPKP
jgi:hypothetical protein